MNLVTWNLKGSDGPDLVAVVGHLRSVGADVVALQEVRPRQARAIARGLGAVSYRWGFKHWPMRPVAQLEGLAVIGVSRPVTVRNMPLSFRFRPWSWRRRIFQLAVIDDGGSPRRLANVHLTPHDQPTIRAREIEALLRAEASTPGLVVAGDLNDGPEAAIFSRLSGAGFRDAWSVLHPDRVVAEGATNWPRWRPGTAEPPSRRLDYVLVPPEVEVQEARVPAPGDHGFARLATLSDHLPVKVGLSWTD